MYTPHITNLSLQIQIHFSFDLVTQTYSTMVMNEEPEIPETPFLTAHNEFHHFQLLEVCNKTPHTVIDL